MPEFRVRLEFDVDIDSPSHIDAAFAAAEWLERRGDGSRFDKLVYETRRHGEEQWYETDLEIVEELSDDEPPLDTNPCVLARQHLKGQRHSWLECPTRTGATTFINQITGERS